jgi:long-chain acyl-CoA synthetase
MAAHADADLAWLEAQVAELSPTDPAFIVYTSGTTGHPKGALVAHGAHLAATANIVAHYPILAAREQRTVVHLPLCHVLGRDVAVTLPLISRLVPHFGEEPDDLPSTLFEVAPTVLFMVPRLLQKLAAQVLIGISSTSSVKRAAYEMAMRFARGHVRRRWEGSTTAGERAKFSFWHASMFRPVLNKLGLAHIELMVSGGAALPSDTATLWQAFGVNVVEMYGQTETAGGIISGQKGPFPRPGDVGTVPEGWTVTLSADGEVLVRSPDLFRGYWNNPEATAAVFTSDGALRTGDIAEWHGDRLKLVDRARDFIVTAGGKTISPSMIETAVRASPYVAEVVVLGHGRKYLTALIEIDFDTVADWARANDISYAGFTSLAASPRVAGLIRGEIDKANAELARVEQIKDFRIIPKELDPEEEGEPVTPTRKVKRAQMYERFKGLVESMYDDSEERLLAEAVGGKRP